MLIGAMEARRVGLDLTGGGSSGRNINGPGFARSMRIDGSSGLSRIPASLSVNPSTGPHVGSALMHSMQSDMSHVSVDHSLNSLASLRDAAPDIISNEMRSVDLGPVEQSSFVLIDENELLQVKDESDLLKKMGCQKQSDLQVKVVSIFGTTGDGKSHSLNHIFFKGREVFKTSSSQTSCTLGVCGAYSEETKTLILDTEGMLGISNNSKQRKRLLLKVLAISDIIIYRSRSERLTTEMYKFLAEASRAYTKYFQFDLSNVAQRSNVDCNLGPAVYIFHDTRHTSPLINDSGRSPEEQIRENFSRQNMKIEGFADLCYTGEQSTTGDTNFEYLRQVVVKELQNNRVRSARKPGIILDMLKTINKKFSGEIQSSEPAFPDEYFTCTCACTACHARCTLFMNHQTHDSESKGHSCENKCSYNHLLDNKVYLCRGCDSRGERSTVVPKTSSARDNAWYGLAKYAWAGFVLECEKCGVIYRSRQFWYGNENPDKSVVKEEFEHVWPGSIVGGAAHAGRQVLEGMAALGSALSTISAPPSRVVSSWITDQVNPAYWRPNNDCTNCASNKCQIPLTTIHHCRKCGEGFCDDCSSNTALVPERGWGAEPVRVCDMCYREKNQDEDERVAVNESLVRARQYHEVISGTLASVAKMPLDFLKDSTRPSYWVPDEQIKKCSVCEEWFGPRLTLHHCRACGQGVCDPCSPTQKPVKDRGWDNPVRVCNNCL